MTRLARVLAPVFVFALLGLGACASDTGATSSASLRSMPDLVELPTSPQAQNYNPCADACATACVYGCAGCAGGLQQVNSTPAAPTMLPEPVLPAAGHTASLDY